MRKGAIIEKPKNNFVMISKTLVNDNNISNSAKGLFCYLVSKPDNWVFYIDEMAKNSLDTKYAIKKQIKELELNGYLYREAIKENGRFNGWKYYMYNEPKENVKESNIKRKEKQSLINSDCTNSDCTNSDCVDYRQSVNASVNNNNIKTNKNIIKKEIYKEKNVFEEIAEEIYKEYPRKEGKVKGIEKVINLLSNKKITKEELLKSVRNYSKEKEKTDKKYILIFSTFMNGRYEDYLYDSNIVEDKGVTNMPADEIIFESVKRG